MINVGTTEKFQYDVWREHPAMPAQELVMREYPGIFSSEARKLHYRWAYEWHIELQRVIFSVYWRDGFR